MDEVENGHGLYHKEEMPPLLDRAAIGPALHRQESTSCSKYIGWLLCPLSSLGKSCVLSWWVVQTRLCALHEKKNNINLIVCIICDVS